LVITTGAAVTVTLAAALSEPSIAVTDPLPALDAVKVLELPVDEESVPGAVVDQLADETLAALPY
jgi:hypothetical protein